MIKGEKPAERGIELFPYRLMFFMFLTPVAMMGGIFFGMISDFGLLANNGIKLNSETFAKQYGWAVWFVGLWCVCQLITAGIMALSIWVRHKKHSQPGAAPDAFGAGEL